MTRLLKTETRAPAPLARQTASLRSMMASGLFPPEPASTPTTAWTVMGAAGATIGATLVVLARLPHRLAVDTVWAEDGKTFLGAAIRHGWRATFHQYAGYLVLTGRLAGALAAALPVTWAAAVLAVSSALVTSLSAGFAYRALRPHIPPAGPRVALAAALVLMPLASYEVVDSAANMMWYLIPAACLALLWRPPTRAWSWTAGAVCFFAVTSNALSLLLLPLLVLRVLVLPRRDWGGAAAGFVVGAAVQLVVVLTSPGLVATSRPPVTDLVQVYITRVLMATVLGDGMGEALHRQGGMAAVLALSCLVVGLFLVIAWRVPTVRPLLIAFGALQLVLFIEPVYLRWNDLFVPGRAPDLDFASRFMITPVFLLWIVVAAGLTRERTPGSRLVRIPIAALAVCVAVACVVDFSGHGPRTFGPRWSSELRLAGATCAGGGSTVRVLTPPPNRLWYVDLPCSRVQRSVASRR